MSRRGIQEEIPAPLNTALEGQTDSTQVSKQPGCWKVPKHGGERLKETAVLALVQTPVPSLIVGGLGEVSLLTSLHLGLLIY